MHDPSRITAPRLSRDPGYYVVCGECARLGKGSTITIYSGVYAGVIHGPLSNQQLADVLIDEHRTRSDAARRRARLIAARATAPDPKAEGPCESGSSG